MNYPKENSLFSNGLFQNIYTLCEMLQVGNKFEPYILVGNVPKDGSLIEHKFEIYGLSVKMIQLKHILSGEVPAPDAIIETGATISESDIKIIREKNPNIKIAILHYGNIMVNHQMNAAARLHGGKKVQVALERRTDRSAVWLSPHYEYFQQYVEWHYNAKIVRTAPYVWSSRYLDSSIKEYGTQLSDRFDRVAVLEPNLNVTKTSVVPIAIIDAAAQKSNVISKGVVLGTGDWVKDEYHIRWIKDRYSYEKKILTFQNRHRFPQIFSETTKFKCGTLLSHHWCNGLNYVYLEALHMGIPLVHNSEFIKEAGYYYEGFNVIDGANALIEAIKIGRRGMTDQYKESAKEIIWRYSPDNPANIDGYEKLIEELLDS